uniref:Serine--tRNA ligase n=1 Tax=candidate division CPR3 bacterium TaxID=2268181 RepID=A0A7C4R2C8_UNCC3
MLDIKYIRENPDLVKQNCKNRKVDCDIDLLLDLDIKRREVMQKAEGLQAMVNEKSKTKPTEEIITQIKGWNREIKKLEEELKIVEKELKDAWIKVPNMTHPETPIGGEEDFRVVFESEKAKPFSFNPKNHVELMEELGLIDFERGTKVTGSKFFFQKGDLVLLNQALMQYGIDIVTKHGYQLMETPDLAKNEILEGIGFNPRGEETQVYSIDNSDLSLIGTAEITIGGYHANEILDLSNGPKKYVALSHCFRTEAGAYGRESKGLYRVHQFTKLEMFVFCLPEESEKYHEEILSIEKELIEGLGLPYRVIDIASGDLGGPAYKKYDLEAWMTMKRDGDSQGGYGEVTSCSNCTDFQARRLNIRYKNENGKNDFVHTLNGTAVNNVRWPLAIFENYQQEDGSVRVPTVLQKYMNNQDVIRKK